MIAFALLSALFLINGSFCEILYKRELSLKEHLQCSTSGIKAVSIPRSSPSSLQFSLNALDFASSATAFKSSLITFYDRKDRQVASLQLTTLRDQFAQVSLLSDSGPELDSNWEAINSPASLRLAVDVQSGGVYLNGQKLLFQLNIKASPQSTETSHQSTEHSSSSSSSSSSSTAEKPSEWKEIEEFLTSELQESVQLQWQAPLQVISEASKEQAFVNQVATFSLSAVKYVAFDEQVVVSLSIEPVQSFSRFWSLFQAQLPTFQADKETLLMGALISGFVGYLVILTLLSRMTAKKQPAQRPSQQQPLLQSSKASITYAPLSTSQTKSTDILRPILLTKFHRSSQLALLNSSSMHLEIHQQPAIATKQASQSGDVHELSLPSLSLNLADNRHILFPSKLRNFQK